MLYSAGDHVQFGELHFKQGVRLLEKVMRKGMRITRDIITVFKYKKSATKQKAQSSLRTYTEKDKK